MGPMQNKLPLINFLECNLVCSFSLSTKLLETFEFNRLMLLFNLALSNFLIFANDLDDANK